MATKTTHRKNIIEKMKSLNTYLPEFDITIDSLAETLEMIDKNRTAWIRAGRPMIQEYTNKGGATNQTKSCYIEIDLKLKETALRYEKELGITPAQLKRVQVVSSEEDPLDKFIAELNS